MRRSMALLIVACASMAGGVRGADEPGPKKKDLGALQGNWEIVGREFMGKKATKQEIAELAGEMVIKGNKMTQWAEDDGKKTIPSESTFTLPPKAKPRALDLTYTDGELKGESVPAIYEVSGDTLR